MFRRTGRSSSPADGVESGAQGLQGGPVSRTNLAASADAVLEGSELFDADRAACMQASCGNADFGAEAKFAAVGELRRGVVQHDRRVDFGEELVGRRPVLG